MPTPAPSRIGLVKRPAVDGSPSDSHFTWMPLREVHTSRGA